MKFRKIKCVYQIVHFHHFTGEQTMTTKCLNRRDILLRLYWPMTDAVISTVLVA